MNPFVENMPSEVDARLAEVKPVDE